MSRSQVPFGHDAMAVLTLASAAEQSVLPYVQDTLAGQQAGHFRSALGGSAGQGGLGGAFEPIRHVDRVQRAMRVPHCPKSHVVPSGSRQTLPFVGSWAGHSAPVTEPVSAPLSGPGVVVALPSPQAPVRAAAAEPMTSAAAICAPNERQKTSKRAPEDGERGATPRE
jgi:hypothetical protein